MAGMQQAGELSLRPLGDGRTIPRIRQIPHLYNEARGKGMSEGGIMLVDVDGVNPAFRDKVIAMVEGITEPMTFKLSSEKGNAPQSVVFECSEDDPDKVVPFLKSYIKRSELGNIMMFRVTPHGQFMWIPKRS